MCLTVCQMALCFAASSQNRNGGFTPGFIPGYEAGMPESSLTREACSSSFGFTWSKVTCFLLVSKN